MFIARTLFDRTKRNVLLMYLTILSLSSQGATATAILHAANQILRAAVGMGIPMGMGMVWVWGL